MKIDLPLETWTDVFAFMPRHKLVQLVPGMKRKHKRAGRKYRPIWNRQFVSFVQFYLHKCGHVEIDSILEIRYPTGGNEAVVFKVYQYQNQFISRALPLADVPMPENIKNFKEINIRSSFDQPVLRFLQHFSRNSLFTNVQLHIRDSDSVLPFLTTIMPLIDSFEDITIYNPHVLALMQNECSAMAMPMLRSARVLDICYNSRHDWLYEWLCTPRVDGKPRVLSQYFNGNNFGDYLPITPLIEYVKKEFREAKEPISFFIQCKCFIDSNFNVQLGSLNNPQTKERLVIKWPDHDRACVTISRHPMEATEEWIELQLACPDLPLSEKYEPGDFRYITVSKDWAESEKVCNYGEFVVQLNGQLGKIDLSNTDSELCPTYKVHNQN